VPLDSGVGQSVRPILSVKGCLNRLWNSPVKTWFDLRVGEAASVGARKLRASSISLQAWISSLRDPNRIPEALWFGRRDPQLSPVRTRPTRSWASRRKKLRQPPWAWGPGCVDRGWAPAATLLPAVAQMASAPAAGAWQAGEGRSAPTPSDLARKAAVRPRIHVQFGEGGSGTSRMGKAYHQVRVPSTMAARC